MNPDRPADKSPPGSVRILPENSPHDSATLPHPIPAIPDHELVRRIGGGSYGEVWLARNVLGDCRAVKVIYRDKFEHDRPFDREFEGIQKFEPISRLHESQVDILHVGRNDAAGYFYYVMELADDAVARVSVAAGVTRLTSDSEVPNPKSKIDQSRLTSAATYVPHTLKLDLYRRGRLPVDECIQIGLALTTALEHLHSHGLVHRDIKPSNIIFVNGVPKLADIGLVASMDATMSFVGTSGFLPPEGPGTARGDIYSLGKVLYEIGTGRDRQEFPKLPPELLVAESRESAAGPVLPEAENGLKSTALSRDAATTLLELNAVILKACHRDPRQRYQSAKDMAADLALLQRGKSVRRTRTMKHRLVLGTKVLVALTALGLVVIGAYSFRDTGNSTVSQHRRPEHPEVTSLCKLGRFHYYKITDEGGARAMECFNKALEIDPNSVEAYACIADISVGFNRGEAELRRARDKLMAIDNRRAEPHAVEGYIQLVFDWNPIQAEKELKLALQVDPELLIAHIWYARYLLYTGKFEDAEREFKKARQIEPARYGLHLYIGLPSYFARDYDAAIRHFENAIKMIPNPDWAFGLVGRANEEKGDFPAAVEAFQKSEIARGGKLEVVRQKFDELRKAYRESGQEGYWRERLKVALGEFQQLGSQAAAINLAEVYMHVNERDGALRALEKAFQEKSEDLLWLNVDPCWNNVRADPRFIALLEKMGFRVAAARIQHLSPAELAGTKSSKAYKKYEEGRTAYRQGNAEGDKEALKFLREAVDLDPNFIRAWEELFTIYINGEGAEAKSQQRVIAEKLNQLNANSAEAYAAQAWIAYEDFEFARADNEFQRAIRLDPSRPRPHRRYGVFLMQCGRLQEARRELGECETLEPGSAATQYLLGDCFFVERKYPQALAQYEKTLKLAQQEMGAYWRLGRLYEAVHKIPDAMAAFEKLRMLAGEDSQKIAQRYQPLRQAFERNGESGYWTKRLEQASAELNPEKGPYDLAIIHARLGHTEQALALLEKAWEVKDLGLKFLILDQHWDELRDNERFKELLKKIGYRTN